MFVLIRVCHTACLGSDNDVVVFGGSSNLCILMDSVRDDKASQLLTFCVKSESTFVKDFTICNCTLIVKVKAVI